MTAGTWGPLISPVVRPPIAKQPSPEAAASAPWAEAGGASVTATRPKTLAEADELLEQATKLAATNPQGAKKMLQVLVAAANQNTTTAGTPRERGQWHLKAATASVATFIGVSRSDFVLLRAAATSTRRALEAAPNDASVAIAVGALLRELAAVPGAQRGLSLAADIDLQRELTEHVLPRLMQFTNNALSLVLAREIAKLTDDKAVVERATAELKEFRDENPAIVSAAEARYLQMEAAGKARASRVK